jgi:Holliday junction resolvase RusA-like endonuclease
MTRRDKWAKRPCVLRYRAFKDQVRLRRVELPQPCRVIFWVAMPKSWSESKQRAHVGKPHQQTPDLDNLLKGLGDAVLTEDKHIWNIHAEKRWGRRGAIQVDEMKDTP